MRALCLRILIIYHLRVPIFSLVYQSVVLELSLLLRSKAMSPVISEKEQLSSRKRGRQEKPVPAKVLERRAATSKHRNVLAFLGPPLLDRSSSLFGCSTLFIVLGGASVLCKASPTLSSPCWHFLRLHFFQLLWCSMIFSYLGRLGKFWAKSFLQTDFFRCLILLLTLGGEASARELVAVQLGALLPGPRLVRLLLL